MDRYLQGRLKNWAGQKQPPESVRSRLILLATVPLDESIPAVTYYEEHRPLRSEPLPRQAGQDHSYSYDVMLIFQVPSLKMI